MLLLHRHLYVAVGTLLILYHTLASTVVVSKCSDGIIIGSDSLAVSGPLVRNRVARNVYDLEGADSIICCCSSTSGQADFHHLLTDLQRFLRSNREDEDLAIAYDSDNDGTRRIGQFRKISTSALARYARRLITKKYRKAHVVIAGAEFDDGRVAGTSACAVGEQSATPATQPPLGLAYSIHEIVDGGSHFVHDDFVVAGSGSDLVHALLTNLLESANSSSKDEGHRVAISPQVCARTVRQALRSAATVDPRTGAELRLWLFGAGKGLKRIDVG